MNEKPIDELIDDYVTGQLSRTEKIYLEDLVAKDPEVAAHLNSAKVAYDILERHYYRHVKKKLQDFDRSVGAEPDMPSKKILRVAIYSVIIMALCWLISFWYFQPTHLAKRFYYSSTEQAQSMDSVYLIFQLWSDAHVSFLKNDFTKAEETYQLILAYPETGERSHAEWNLLLCQLALHGFTPEWRDRLDEIISQANGPIKGKAIQLKKQINSWIYTLTFLPFSEELSSLKPRLI